MTLAAQVSANYVYEKVYFCGDNLDRDVLRQTHGDYKKDFYIHFDKNDEVVILHGSYQYSTLEPRKYDHLYAQNGALTILEIKEKVGDIITFEMKNLLNSDKETLVVDFSNLTYLYRFSTSIQMYAPSYGACKLDFPRKD